MEDCADQVGAVKFVTKLDLLKGYRQIPLTERARGVTRWVILLPGYELRPSKRACENQLDWVHRCTGGPCLEKHPGILSWCRFLLVLIPGQDRGVNWRCRML